MEKIKLSVIIPTYNEEKDIGICIKSLFDQSYKNLEIIVVDDGSKDNTIEVVKNFNTVKILKGEHKGPGFSRNLGAKMATGEILIFIDADMTFQTDYLEKLVKPILENNDVIGTTHELEIVDNIKNIWSRCWGRIRVKKEDAGKIKIFRAIRKKMFLEKGGFDPKYGYADDQTLWFKYKIGPTVAKDTICYHRNPETLKSVYRQSKWIGSSQSYLLLNIPIINMVYVFLLILISPINIILLTFKKCYYNKDFLIIHYMIVFMTARYFGNINGYIQKIGFDKNIR